MESKNFAIAQYAQLRINIKKKIEKKWELIQIISNLPVFSWISCLYTKNSPISHPQIDSLNPLNKNQFNFNFIS